jgi:hypothetical protein
MRSRPVDVVFRAVCKIAEGARGRVVSLSVKRVKRYIDPRALTFPFSGSAALALLRQVLDALPEGSWRPAYVGRSRVYIVDVEALREACRAGCRK